jgi:hypothetical protein
MKRKALPVVLLAALRIELRRSPAPRRQRPRAVDRRRQVQQAADDVAVENRGACIWPAVGAVVDAAVGALDRPAEGVKADG